MIGQTSYLQTILDKQLWLRVMRKFQENRERRFTLDELANEMKMMRSDFASALHRTGIHPGFDCRYGARWRALRPAD